MKAKVIFYALVMFVVTLMSGYSSAYAQLFHEDFEDAVVVSHAAPFPTGNDSLDADPAHMWVLDKDSPISEQVTNYVTPGPVDGSNYLRLQNPTDTEAAVNLPTAQSSDFRLEFDIYTQYDGIRVFLKTGTTGAGTDIGGWLTWGEAGSGVIGYRWNDGSGDAWWATTCAYATDTWQHVMLDYNYDAVNPTMNINIDGSTATGIPFYNAANNAIGTILFTGGSGAWNPDKVLYIDNVEVNFVTLDDIEVPTTEIVTIDLATDIGPVTHAASGILASMSIDSPADEYITALKPHMWRERTESGGITGTGVWACHDRIYSLGFDTIIAVLGHGFGTSPLPGAGGDWTTWDNYVHDQVTTALNGGYVVQWDIWNEPPNNWEPYGGTTEQFNEMWRRAVDQIRTLYAAAGEPTPVIVGPSTGGYSPDYIHAFLLYARDNLDSRGGNVLPDVLSWHEAGWYNQSYLAIPTQVVSMRTWMADNGINIQRISLSEIIGSHIQTNPGAVARFLISVDESGVENAAKMCWPDEIGDNCNNHSLDGLLHYQTFKPRSTWWVYKAYADLTGTLADVTPSFYVGGIASQECIEGSNVVRVLLGRDGGTEDVQLNFNNVPCIAAGCQVQIIAKRIPDSGWNELTSPTEVINAFYPIVGGQVTVALPNFGTSDAYEIQLIHEPLTSDLNYNCSVTLEDFYILASHWLECTAPQCD